MRILLLVFALLVPAHGIALAQRLPKTNAPRIDLRDAPTVTGAPTVERKDLSEFAALAFVCRTIRGPVTLQHLSEIVPRSASRPDMGWVEGWGVELRLIPEIAQKLGLHAEYVPKLTLRDAAERVSQGRMVMYRARYASRKPANSYGRWGAGSPLAPGSFTARTPDQFAIVLISVSESKARIYDPYTGIVTLSDRYIGAAGTTSLPIDWPAYALDASTVPFEAVVFDADAPQKAVLIQTHWSQSAPANIAVPEFVYPQFESVKAHAPAGAAAVALAQVLAYFESPTQGTGVYTDKFANSGGSGHPGDMPILRDFGRREYKWGPIKSLSAGSLSELLLDCGVAVDADYACREIGLPSTPISTIDTPPAAIIRALRDQFGYDLPGRTIDRNKVPADEDWMDYLKHEIDSGRPVIYLMKTAPGVKYCVSPERLPQGYPYHRPANVTIAKGAKHVAIVDGYRISAAEMLIHVNFGWGGIGDGWYPLNGILDPVYNWRWNEHIQAIIGISPSNLEH